MNSETPIPPTRQPLTRRPLIRLLLAGLAINLMLVLPAWWRDGQPGSVWLSPEAWLVVALVLVLPERAGRSALRLALAGALALVIIAGVFDGLVRSVLSRPLNVVIDVLMLRAGFNLIDGSIGPVAAIAAAMLAALAAAGIGWAVWRMLGHAPRPGRGSLLAVIVIGLGLSLPWAGPRLPGVEPLVVTMVDQQIGELSDTRRARRELLAAEDDPAFAARALPGLAGRDVYIVLIESYGTSALDQDRYAEHLAPLLERWQGRLKGAGMAMASGRVAAPIRGGQSWLAHATLLSGLAIDNDLWYRMLLERDIDLLSADFRATGHAALKLAPAIVMDWPEGEQLGFDRVLAADDMGYAGPSLGWVTMPDEFTLHAFGDQIRPRHDRPVFAQIALISSHWPWSPVIEPLADPERIVDGQVYERWRDSGGNPVSLWLDPDALRRAYAQSVAYSLEVTLDWARRSLPEDALLIVLGDHQPASVITGREASAAVPVHVISRDGALLAGFEARGFVPGLLPDLEAGYCGMEWLRHWLREDFGTSGQKKARPPGPGKGNRLEAGQYTRAQVC